MKIEFVKVERTTVDYKGSTYPRLVLSYNLGKKVIDWGISVTSARILLKAHDEKWEDYKAHENEKWSTPIDLFGNGDVYELSRTKIQVVHHYLDDIKSFIKDNTKPRILITEPKVEVIEEEDTGDYIKVLLLPCYPKSEFEEGEGMGAMTISQKDARYLFDTSSVAGIHILDIKNHFASDKKDTTLEKKCVTRLGKEYVAYKTPEQVRCIMKYKQQISNFKDGIDIDF